MTATVSQAIRRIKASVALVELVRYFLCSALAFAVDCALFGFALHVGLPYQAAAVAGFVGGVATAYALSVRWAFCRRSVTNARVEFLVFLGVGLVGLGLTEALLWLQIGMLGFSPMFAKLATAVAVFLFNFGARKLLLFTRRSSLPVTVGV